MRAAPLPVPAAHDMNPLRCGLFPAINQQSCPSSWRWAFARRGKLIEQDPLLSLRVFRSKVCLQLKMCRAAPALTSPVNIWIQMEAKWDIVNIPGASATKARSEGESNYSWTDCPVPSTVILVCRLTRKWPESNLKTTQGRLWVLCVFTSVNRWTTPWIFTGLGTVWSLIC